jgi:hypothetical protein
MVVSVLFVFKFDFKTRSGPGAYICACIYVMHCPTH